MSRVGHSPAARALEDNPEENPEENPMTAASNEKPANAVRRKFDWDRMMFLPQASFLARLLFLWGRPCEVRPDLVNGFRVLFQILFQIAAGPCAAAPRRPGWRVLPCVIKLARAPKSG
jgi:hypothetical protein